jgi:hypothetical protein
VYGRLPVPVTCAYYLGAELRDARTRRRHLVIDVMCLYDLVRQH